MRSAAVIFAALLTAGGSAAGQAIVDGKGAPTFSIPRIDATISIDGILDEAPWASASKLIGFSQYDPVDGRPAEEDTEVLVWYAPDALYFGVIAHDRNPGAV